jgi:hypothetical protein
MSGRREGTIGAGAGFAGDLTEPAVELLASGLVRDVALECLAERTLVAGLRAREADPAAGYDPRLRRRFSGLLPHVAEGGGRVIGNLGAANPLAGAEAVVALARELGLQPPKVAAVLGDDVAARAEEVEWLGDPEGGKLIGAHAYLGSDAIAAALAEGADVVLTGRVADSALFSGPLREVVGDSPDALAGALVVGHLLECTCQLSGGNFTAPGGGRLAPSDLWRIGYPLARVEASGEAEISLLPGASGRLDRLTCTLQLLYEVHDPSRYITPDGVVDMTGIGFEEPGKNRVRVSGARLGDRPECLKVSGFFELPGTMVDAEIGFAGADALPRARDAAEVVRLALAEKAGIAAPRIDLVGVDSLLGAASQPLGCDPPELRLHVSAHCPDAEVARDVEDLVYWLTLGGPAQGGGIRVERRASVATVDGRLDRELVTEEVAWAG